MKVRRWWQRVWHRVCGCLACERYGGFLAGLLVSVGKHESFVRLVVFRFKTFVLLASMPSLYNRLCIT